MDKEKILNNTSIKVYILENQFDIYNEIAQVMLEKLKNNNYKGKITSFILPVGPRGQYSRFARLCNIEKVSCKNLILINMDEYLDPYKDKHIPENNVFSFRRFMKDNLYNLLDSKVRLKSENIFFPDPNKLGVIDEIINELGGVDICFGGVGINGHIGFNEPISEDLITLDDFKILGTRIVNISLETILVQSLRYGGDLDIVPRKAVTIGIKEILKAKELRFYLEHNRQAAVLRKAIFMEPTSRFPITIIKEHKKSSITITENVLSNYWN